MEDIAADITQRFAMADMDQRARSLSIGTKLYDQIHYSALESLGSITAKQIQMQESIKPFLGISIKPFLGMQYEAKKSLDVSSINQLELFAHDRSSSIQWPRCGPEIPRSEKLCKLHSELENGAETDIAQSLQRLLITCNRAKKINGKDAIFKYTDKFVEAIVTLSRINSGDEHSLGDLIDALYLLVCEGAGKDKLRFLCDFGGPLKSQDCEFVWHLKHLRNKWLRHDIEHGN